MTEIRRAIHRALVDGSRVRADLDVACIERAGIAVRDAVLAGRKVLLCGNGGSAADAQHIAAELVGRFVCDRRPLPAIALTTDTSALTAIANDFGYEQVFARQITALGSPDDVLIAISTSGNSTSILAAVAAARQRGMRVVGLTGAKGAVFAASCDVGIVVSSYDTARIQECHITIGHILCELIDRAFAPTDAVAIDGTEKLMSLGEVVAWRHAQRARHRTVVWTNGVFDVFHIGHLESLRAARRHGDVLVVGINADDTVRVLKGPTRPMFPARERAAVLAALEIVDVVTIFDEPTPERVLAAITPDVHVKGADYAPPDGKPIPEADVVVAYGGRIEFVPLVSGRSSSAIIERLG